MQVALPCEAYLFSIEQSAAKRYKSRIFATSTFGFIVKIVYSSYFSEKKGINVQEFSVKDPSAAVLFFFFFPVMKRA